MYIRSGNRKRTQITILMFVFVSFPFLGSGNKIIIIDYLKLKVKGGM